MPGLLYVYITRERLPRFVQLVEAFHFVYFLLDRSLGARG